MKRAVRLGLEIAAAEHDVNAAVPGAEHRLTLAGFPNVGPVDLAVLGTDDQLPEALIELKWGGGSLFNCIWDLPKLALAMRVGAARSAWLIAGAPESSWSTCERGTELFLGGSWETERFMDEYADLFDYWQAGQDSTGPLANATSHDALVRDVTPPRRGSVVAPLRRGIDACCRIV